MSLKKKNNNLLLSLSVSANIIIVLYKYVFVDFCETRDSFYSRIFGVKRHDKLPDNLNNSYNNRGFY